MAMTVAVCITVSSSFEYTDTQSAIIVASWQGRISAYNSSFPLDDNLPNLSIKKKATTIWRLNSCFCALSAPNGALASELISLSAATATVEAQKMAIFSRR